MMKIEEHLDAIQPAEAVWNLSASLKDKIDLYVWMVILSPSLSEYLNGSGIKVISVHYQVVSVV